MEVFDNSDVQRAVVRDATGPTEAASRVGCDEEVLGQYPRQDLNL